MWQKREIFIVNFHLDPLFPRVYYLVITYYCSNTEGRRSEGERQ